MKTIGEKLTQQKGFGAGFDFLRVFLSLSVLFVHSFLIVTGDTNYPLIWFASYWVLAIFFGLSGFLICGSAMRLSLSNFLINRGIRIFPALAVEIFLAVLVLGPLFTTVGYHEYFFSKLTLKYLANIVGYVNYLLPGVFEGHPSPRVNTSLWTVPFELGCYLIISIFIISGVLKKPAAVLGVALAVVISGLILVYFIGPTLEGVRLYKPVEILLVDRGSKLFAGFLLGIAAYLHRDKIPYDRRIFAVCLTFSAAFSFLPSGEWANVPLLNALTIAPLTYVMVFVGVSPMPKLPFFSTGDYSYGIYLYGFPLQQATLAIFHPTSPIVLFIECLPIVLLIAFLSWHLVEKPLVLMRKKFSFSAKERLSAS